MAERLKGFNVTILVYDPYVSQDVLKGYGAKQVTLPELLKQADYVSLHARASAETKGLIGESELKLMKPTAYLINTARAELVDEKALNNALKNNQIKGAALDVFWDEPLNVDDPIKTLDNATLTPHLAGFTYETSLRTISLFLENLKGFLEKHQNSSVVNFKPTQQLEITKGMKLVQ